MGELDRLGVEAEIARPHAEALQFLDGELAQRGEIGANRHRADVARKMDQAPGRGDQWLGTVKFGLARCEVEPAAARRGRPRRLGR